MVLLILGTTGLGAAGWVYTHPPTTEITDHTDQRTVKSSLSTHAVVTGESSFYPPGTRIDDQPVYLTKGAPNISLTLGTRLPPDAADTSVDHRIELVYTASRDGDVFWRRTETLGTSTTRDGDRVITTATLSMPRVLSRTADYRKELGDAATVSVSIDSDVTYRFGPYDGEFSKTTPIRSGSGWYAIEPVTASETHSTTEARTVELDVVDSPRFLVPGGVGAVLFVAGLLVAGSYHLSGRRSVAGLKTAVHHQRYADWITQGTLPEGTARTAVGTDSLEGLVDVAIDTGERVIYDAERGQYAVLHGQTRYVHIPDDE
ncbi:DUF5305 family protein [Haloplanus sp. C73]|uniref:DUF5305 family protein n=1 Tax=Haloplanus sp. C73 TaxID=3421641 RepID=UPI003EB6DF5A